jgi:putative transposase
MEKRGVSVDHSTINRWAMRFLPLIEKMARKHKRPVGSSWRMGETYIKFKGVWNICTAPSTSRARPSTSC